MIRFIEGFVLSALIGGVAILILGRLAIEMIKALFLGR